MCYMVDKVQKKRFVSLRYTASLKVYSVELKTTEFQTLVLYIYIYIYLFIFIYIYLFAYLCIYLLI